MKRLLWLDLYRGFSVVTMIIFHFTYDLNLFELTHFNFLEGFWYYFPRFIAFSFLWCVGASIGLEHRPHIKVMSFQKRFFKLLACALAVSLVTYFTHPNDWIYFGTLHCIAFCSLLALPFRNRPRLLWACTLLMLALAFGFGFDVSWLSQMIKKNSMDFIPVYPWLAVVLMGLSLGPKLFSVIPAKTFPGDKGLLFLGRHSLVIYLVHQPLLFAFVWSISKVFV